jgi:hypothetical protein
MKEFNYVIKSQTMSIDYGIAVRIDDETVADFSEVARMLATSMSEACLSVYHHFAADYGLKCYFINTAFVKQFGRYPHAMTDCNYLYIESLGKTQATTHHMIQMQQDDLFIGVDVATKQYREDKIVAEIIIAKSMHKLFSMLTERHQTTAPWEVNKMHKNTNLRNWLKPRRDKLAISSLFLEQENKKEEKKKQSQNQETPSCACLIQ